MTNISAAVESCAHGPGGSPRPRVGPVNHEQCTPGLSSNPSTGGSIVAVAQHMGRKWTNVPHLQDLSTHSQIAHLGVHVRQHLH